MVARKPNKKKQKRREETEIAKQYLLQLSVDRWFIPFKNSSSVIAVVSVSKPRFMCASWMVEVVFI